MDASARDLLVNVYPWEAFAYSSHFLSQETFSNHQNNQNVLENLQKAHGKCHIYIFLKSCKDFNICSNISLVFNSIFLKFLHILHSCEILEFFIKYSDTDTHTEKPKFLQPRVMFLNAYPSNITAPETWETKERCLPHNVSLLLKDNQTTDAFLKIWGGNVPSRVRVRKSCTAGSGRGSTSGSAEVSQG